MKTATAESTVLSLRLPVDLVESVRVRASEDERTVSSAVRLLMKRYAAGAPDTAHQG